MRHGFTFIQVSILLTVISLVLVACLPAPNISINAARITTERMNTVFSALRQFEAGHGRLPCPGDASLPGEDTNYGIEAPAVGSTLNCSGSSPAANYTDNVNLIAVGSVPIRTLGLSNSYATDGWGRLFTYAVDTRATQCFQNTLSGAIQVVDQGRTISTVSAVVSHGKDGHGAWIPLNGNTGHGVRLNSGTTDADELTDAHVDASFTATQPLNGFVRKLATATFGDLVTYSNGQWNLNQPPSVSGAVFPALGVPASHTYIAGQALSFSLTYPWNVIVAGTPRISLTIGGVTRYANYISGSGSPVLTFSYTIQNSDYAPAGISAQSTLDMTLGSVNAPCNSFASPSLAGLSIKKLYIYVTDYGNNRVQVLDATGSYQNSFGSTGISAGQFVSPRQPLADGLGNIWVSDWGNSRVQKFTAAGSYLGAFGSLGIANGQLINAGSLALDAGGNLWVADEGNNRIEQFSPAGVYMSKFGSAGVANGQFIVPTGIAIDSAGNIWVGDWGNSRIEQFNSAGVYLSKFGSVGAGNGQFVNPCGQAFDASGNLWVVDNGNSRLQKFSSSGSYLAQFGSFGTGGGQLFNPCGVAVDIAGNIWVGDGGNNRVQEFSASGSYLRQFGTYGTGLLQFHTPSNIGLYYQ